MLDFEQVPRIGGRQIVGFDGPTVAVADETEVAFERLTVFQQRRQALAFGIRRDHERQALLFHKGPLLVDQILEVAAVDVFQYHVGRAIAADAVVEAAYHILMGQLLRNARLAHS